MTIVQNIRRRCLLKEQYNFIWNKKKHQTLQKFFVEIADPIIYSLVLIVDTKHQVQYDSRYQMFGKLTCLSDARLFHQTLYEYKKCSRMFLFVFFYCVFVFFFSRHVAFVRLYVSLFACWNTCLHNCLFTGLYLYMYV